MAIITQVVEGFDLVDNNTDLVERTWDFADGTVLNDGGSLIAGKRYYSLDTGTANVLSKACDYAAYTRISFWFKAGVGTTGGSIVRLANTQSDISDGTLSSSSYRAFYMSYLINGSVTLHGYNDGLKFITRSGIIRENQWHCIELLVYLGNSGWSELKVDGVWVANRTQTTGDYYIGASGASPMFYGDITTHCYDDIVLTSATTEADIIDWLGCHEITTLLPTADTVTADFTGSYLDIDDSYGSHDGDLSTITGVGAGTASKFEIGDLTGNPEIHKVQVNAVLKKSDTEINTVQTTLTTGGVEAEGAIISTAEVYETIQDTYIVSPDTGLPFTATEINNTQIGIKIAS